LLNSQDNYLSEEEGEEVVIPTTNQATVKAPLERADHQLARYEQVKSQQGGPLFRTTRRLLESAVAPNHSEAESSLALDQIADQTSAQHGDADSEMIKHDVMRMEQALADALVQSDAANLGQLLADDLTHTNPFGNLKGKSPWIAAVKAGHIKFSSFRYEDVQIRIYGETAVVTAINILRVEAAGSDLSGQYRSIHVWVRREGRWRLTAHQATRISPRRRR
jgi:ketosteroid isomerase-like protein